MYLDGDQVYCIHLHPGTECSWSEVVKRASIEVSMQQQQPFHSI